MNDEYYRAFECARCGVKCSPDNSSCVFVEDEPFCQSCAEFGDYMREEQESEEA